MTGKILVKYDEKYYFASTEELTIVSVYTNLIKYRGHNLPPNEESGLLPIYNVEDAIKLIENLGIKTGIITAERLELKRHK